MGNDHQDANPRHGIQEVGVDEVSCIMLVPAGFAVFMPEAMLAYKSPLVPWLTRWVGQRAQPYG